MIALARRLAPSLLVVANQGFNSLVNLAITLWLIRALGISEFGVYAVYWLVCLVAVSVVVALIVLPMVSLAGHLEGRQQAQMISAASVLTAVVAVTLLAIVLVSQSVGLGWEGALIPVAAVTTAQLIVEFTRRTLFFLRRAIAVWLFDLLRYGLLASCYVWLAMRGSATPLDFVLAMATANGAASIAFGIVLWRIGGRALDMAEFGPNTRRLFQNGRWLALSNLVQFANDNLFIVVASTAISPTATGILRTCQTIVGLINPLIQTLEHVLPRRLGEDIVGLGRGPAFSHYVTTSQVVLIGFAVLLGALALVAEPVLSLASSGQATGYGWLLQVFCALNMLVAFVVLTNILLRALERTLPIFISPLLAAVVSLLAAFPLASSFGLAGVAGGMLGAQVIIALLQLRAARVAVNSTASATAPSAPTIRGVR